MNTTTLSTLENYSANKPYVSYGGRDVSFEVEYDGNYMEVNVEMEWCGRYDELVIEAIHAECYDENEEVVDVTSLDLDALVVEVFEANNTFSEVEMMMQEAYHNDHKD